MPGEALPGAEAVPALHMSCAARCRAKMRTRGRRPGECDDGYHPEDGGEGRLGDEPLVDMVWTSGAWRTPLITTPLVMPRPCGQRLPRSPSSLTIAQPHRPCEIPCAPRELAHHDSEVQGSMP